MAKVLKLYRICTVHENVYYVVAENITAAVSKIRDFYNLEITIYKDFDVNWISSIEEIKLESACETIIV